MALPVPVSPLVGGKLGRYEVIKQLAQGGMAEVLLGRSVGIEGFERYVVIKRIRQDQARDQQFVRMFLDEARLVASLHHNNILQVQDIGEEAGEYFFTMEYIHGQDIRKILKRASALEECVPIEHVVTMMMGAASGLHFAHEHRNRDGQALGIVHRDVSLSNIMIGYDGFVKVTDFGIAKAVLSADTHSGVLKGKVAYMSPEQCLGKPVDRRSDVYSLGIVLYELVTSRRLFKADSDFLTMSAIVDGTIPPPSQFRAEIVPELEAIVVKALSRRSRDRYQTADEMRAALEDFAINARLRTSITSLGAYMKRLFGEQPEPWVSDAPVEMPDDSDFDGSASGIVDPGTDALRELKIRRDDTPIPSLSPIMRARTRAITNVPKLVDRMATNPAEAVDELPRSKGKWLALGALAIAGGVTAFVLATREPDAAATTTTPEPAAAPVEAPSQPVPVAAPDPEPQPTPVVEPPAPPPPPPPPPTPPPVEQPVVKAKPPIKRPPPPKGKKPPKQNPGSAAKKGDPKWDPDELLP